MLTVKYEKEFLRLYDEVNNKRQLIKDVIIVEQETGVALLDWDDTEVASFLKKAESVSPMSLNRRMTILRKFADLICTREKLAKRKYIMEDGVFMQMIDRSQLAASTLSYDQYCEIKNQLGVSIDGETVNVRDKVIFELAWMGLTNDEIRMVKSEEIEFVKTENDWEIAIINIDDKIIRVEDPEVTADIKLCMKELYNVIFSKDGRVKKMFYKESEYLVKPIAIGRTSNKTYLNNPHLSLQHVLKSGEIVCQGIDVESLTLSDIRRSRLIYLLAPENEIFFDFQTIAGIYNLKRPEGLRWYREIAREKYGVK